MDKRIEQIVEGLERLLNGNLSNAFLATVITDKADTVDVEDLNGTKFLDVRKIATQGRKGFIPALPKGSFVIVSRISGSDDLFVSMFSEIEGIEYSDKSGLECVIMQGKLSFKNRNYSLKKAFDDLFSAIAKLTVTTGVGPSGTPINITEFQAIQQNLNNLLR